MYFESLEFKLAENRLQHLENEMDPVIVAHYEAKACYECERSIGFSILVYESISAAEKTMLDAEREGVQEFRKEQYDAIKLIYQRWLVLGDILVREAEVFSSVGYEVDRRKRFLECYEDVSDWLERSAWQESATSLLNERFEKEEANEVASTRGDLSP